MTISALQPSPNSTQNYLDAHSQCPARQGFHSTHGSVRHFAGVNHFSSNPKQGDDSRSLSCRHSIATHRYDTSHTHFKGAANHSRVVHEGRAVTKMVAMAAVLSFGGAGATESITSEFSHQQKTQYRVMTNRAAGSREAMAREKHTTEPKGAGDSKRQEAKSSDLGKESSELENKNQENSVLYQGRKNHDHYSNEGRKIKKYLITT
ncbi:hypothetical protein [Endozoicomonas atrinae]|uniref:hypothetical protein n=1 Tax=Endozoicomonas atrinae TaxID=1333660 RepID=UPI003B00BFF0